MRPADIEAWTLEIIERSIRGERTEDTRVEVKSQWPNDLDEAARQIAGHANAARGESILWIIGLDERAHKVTGAPQRELAVWWEGVRSKFDGVFPALTDLNVPVEGTSVASLYFETDRAPYIVANPRYGREKGGISYEVPWREGTSTRTARRADLLRLLVPITHSPAVEVWGADLSCKAEKDGRLTWGLYDLRLYVEPALGEEVVIVFPRCRVLLEVPGFVNETPMIDISMVPPYVPARGHAGSTFLGWEPDTATAVHTGSEMIFHGPGRGNLRARCKTAAISEGLENSKAIVTVELAYSHGEKPLKIRTELVWRGFEPEGGLFGAWRFGAAET